MKITDNELMCVFVENQLCYMAERMLINVVGGKTAIDRDDDIFYHTYMYHRQIQTKKLSVQQKLKRLRKLVDSSLISFADRNNLSFRLDNEKTRASYKAAREFYIAHGIGFFPDDCKVISNRKELVKECQDMLLNRFGGDYCFQGEL